jgi:hypothetical protein
LTQIVTEEAIITKKGWGGKLPALTFLIIIGEMLAYITEMS